MHSAWNRLNAIFTYASTVICVMLALNSLSVFFLPPPEVPISMEIHEDSFKLFVFVKPNSFVTLILILSIILEHVISILDQMLFF